VYNVFPQIWKFVFAFGRKFVENEFDFPGFRALRTHPSNSSSNEICGLQIAFLSRMFYKTGYGRENADGWIELAYILRRAELNHRELTEGQSPWSIRQTAVYHKFSLNPNSPRGSKSTFLLIAPSQTLESQLSDVFELSISDESASTPWNVHRLLLAESLRGWMEYMASLERELKDQVSVDSATHLTATHLNKYSEIEILANTLGMGQSDRIVLAKVGEEKENLSPVTDFKVNFVDRQNLKLLEDSVIDLQIILPTMLNTIVRLCDQCKKCCERHCNKGEGKCDCDQIIEEFDEYVKEVEMHVERAKILRERSKSISQLVSFVRQCRM
jgi:hypothetical protein